MSLSTFTPVHSGRNRSSLFDSSQPSKSSKKIKTEDQTKSVDRSTQNSAKLGWAGSGTPWTCSFLCELILALLNLEGDFRLVTTDIIPVRSGTGRRAISVQLYEHGDQMLSVGACREGTQGFESCVPIIMNGSRKGLAEMLFRTIFHHM
ncbi:hypothetical protein Scep_019122 [Stephania cephalantha]|uniref:Uncharacterized protein n=1 Tax=Stephania cephalantha TaxID=152367 RepID=A0AAP0IAM4_9MAGN